MIAVLLVLAFISLVAYFLFCRRERRPNQFIAEDRVILNFARQRQVSPQSYQGFEYPRPNCQRRDPGQRLFCSFIADKVIPSFARQRQQRYPCQFAVLLLIPESDRHNINRVHFKPQDINQQPLVNKKRYSPNRNSYRNYVVARPHLTRQDHVIHSERTLLQELPRLWKAFKASYGSTTCIILYSWLMPCPECTEKICHTLQNTAYENKSVIVAYTNDWEKVPAAENKKSRATLQAAGIEVEEVKPDKDLPPAQDSESDEDEVWEELN